MTIVPRLSIIGSIGVILLFFFFKIYAQSIPLGIYQQTIVGALYELLWGLIVLSVILMPILWGVLYYKKQLSPRVTIPFFIASLSTLVALFFWVQ